MTAHTDPVTRGHGGRAPDRTRLPVLAVTCGALAVLSQIAYPLLAGPALTLATVASVVTFAGACVSHAAWAYGGRAAARVLAGAAGLGLAAEAVGVATGVPFGSYRYASSLGPQLAGVPLVVPLAWTMMAYPALLLGRRLARRRPGRPLRSSRPTVALAGGWTLAAWDLFLDPQMVDAGHWRWLAVRYHLPGVAQVPLTNAGGWLLVGTVIVAVLDRLLPAAGRGSDALPAALLTWTWLGSTLANLAFFHRPWVALYGGLAMAATVWPYLRAVRRDHR